MTETYKRKTIKAEVEAARLRLRRENVARYDAKAITQIVMAEHLDIEGDDAPFFVTAANLAVSQIALECIRATKQGDTEAVQPTLQGYEYLHAEYAIQVGRTTKVVVVTDVVLDEWADKYEELEAQRDGVDFHMNDIVRYVLDKSGVDLRAFVAQRRQKQLQGEA